MTSDYFGQPGDSGWDGTPPAPKAAAGPHKHPLPIPTALGTIFDPTVSGLVSANLQGAMDELVAYITGSVFLTPTGGEKHTVKTVADAGASYTPDMNEGNVHEITLTQNCLIHAPIGATAGRACEIALIVHQNGTGGWTLSFDAAILWPGGSAPTIATAADTASGLGFVTTDGGTTIYGVPGPGTGNVAALNDLTDVTISSPASADRLRYDGAGQWRNSALKWTPVTVFDPTTGNYLPAVDGSGNQIMVEA